MKKKNTPDPKKKKCHGGSLAVSQEDLALLVKTIMNRRHNKRKSTYFYFKNIRDSMAIIFGWYLGLRSKNILEAEMSELNINARKLYLPAYKSKSREQEIVIIPRCIIPRLKFYITIKNKFFPNSRWLFPARGQKKEDVHLNANTFMRIFRDVSKLAGIYKIKFIDKQGHKRSAVTSHGLRKGSATKVWLITGDIEKVAIHLTHTDPRRRATFTYIKAAKEQVRERICDEVFDEVWRDEARVNSQTETLIRLLKLQQNKHIPILKI